MKSLILIPVVFLAACSPIRPRGDFALIAPDAVSVRTVQLSPERVSSITCFPDNRVDVFSDEPIIREAMDAALGKVPGATLLIDMSIEDDTGCVTVSGYPARLEEDPRRSAVLR